MPRLESAPRSLPERGGLRLIKGGASPAPEKKREPHSALVKNKEGEVIGLRTDEQLITKAEAYRGVGARLRAVNDELEDIKRAGRKGFEKREAELEVVGKRLADYLDELMKNEEEDREAFREGAQIMVDNPFYSEEVTELGEGDLEEISESKGVEKIEEPEKVEAGELIYDLDDLRKDYKEMKLESRALDQKLARLESIQGAIVQTISRMMEPGFKHRQALQKLEREAMSIEDYKEMNLPLLTTEIQEAGDREEIRKQRLPQALDAVTGRITRLSEEKVKLAGDIARIVKKILESEKKERAAARIGSLKKAA